MAVTRQATCLSLRDKHAIRSQEEEDGRWKVCIRDGSFGIKIIKEKDADRDLDPIIF